jgi:hypothetical protein
LCYFLTQLYDALFDGILHDGRLLQLRILGFGLFQNGMSVVGGGKKIPGSVGEHERRHQRLQEIMDELVSLTDWKKV